MRLWPQPEGIMSEPIAEPPKGRRILRRLAIVAVVLLMLLVFYVASAVSVTYAYGAGWLPPPVIHVMQVVYAPLGLYGSAKLPGTDTLEWMLAKSHEAGRRSKR